VFALMLGEAGECTMPGWWAISLWDKISAAFTTSAREVFAQSGGIPEACW